LSASTVVALDGPVGVGKSTVAQLLAHELGYIYIDTGAMYRAVTLEAMRRSIDLANESALTDLARSISLTLEQRDDHLAILCDGRDVTDEIRSPDVSRNTSPVADVIGVRTEMVRQQRELGLQRDCVMEGRDIGTVVFPDARWKFYLDASLEERTRRRALQLATKGKPEDLALVRADVIRRDQRDRSRPFGPLLVAPDAIVIDTTMLDETEVVAIIKSILNLAG
jgi:cytidylate kinase